MPEEGCGKLIQADILGSGVPDVLPLEGFGNTQDELAAIAFWRRHYAYVCLLGYCPGCKAVAGFDKSLADGVAVRVKLRKSGKATRKPPPLSSGMGPMLIG